MAAAAPGGMWVDGIVYADERLMADIREDPINAQVQNVAQRRPPGKAAGMGTVGEEMPQAYKDVAEVVGVMEGAGISTRLAQLRPLGVIKG